MTAVFLTGYATRRGDQASLALGHRLLSLNIGGTAAQFDDLDSVQACKFGCVGPFPLFHAASNRRPEAHQDCGACHGGKCRHFRPGASGWSRLSAAR